MLYIVFDFILPLALTVAVAVLLEGCRVVRAHSNLTGFSVTVLQGCYQISERYDNIYIQSCGVDTSQCIRGNILHRLYNNRGRGMSFQV